MASADYEVSSSLGTIAANIVALGSIMEATKNELNSNIAVSSADINRHVETSFDTLKEIVTRFENNFTEFVNIQKRANRLQIAETRVVKVRQELDKKFGHYDVVRRTLTGILQADDLNIVKSSTIENVTEELMLQTPNYWLAPALVALSSWIIDQEEVAKRALTEALHRDDAKTSLMFGLICRRANRDAIALRWIKRYLENQNEKKLGRETLVILDAYTSGLFGNDSDGIVITQIKDWLESLGRDSNYKGRQIEGWETAIWRMKQPLPSTAYPSMRVYCTNAQTFLDCMESAILNGVAKAFFEEIFNKENESADALKHDLDSLLTSLVTEYDDEELPLREAERLENLVIKYGGDEDTAKEIINREKTVFAIEKDFTQLLTDAAMSPEVVHARVSTRKFSISLSKEWIKAAYIRILESYRPRLPKVYEIMVDSFKCHTQDGRDENQITEAYAKMVDDEYKSTVQANRPSEFVRFCLPGGAIISIAGLFIMIAGFFASMGIKAGVIGGGICGIVVGVCMMLYYKSTKSKFMNLIRTAKEKAAEKKKNGIAILRQTISEIVDFKRAYEAYDRKGEDVLQFLEHIRPDQYVKALSSNSSIVREMEEMK